MKLSSLQSISSPKSSILLQKLIELKKSLFSNSNSTFEASDSPSTTSKDQITSLEEMATDTELDNTTSSQEKMSMIRSKIIGLRTIVKSPFGFNLQTLYADHTATNRAYQSIEEVIKYSKYLAANPHTEFSHFGKYSTEMMNYAQLSILQSFQADPRDFVALPTGSGSTGAIEKTLKILKSLKDQKQPTIFLTPYEHHSNILPWVQFYENIKVLPSTDHGDLVYNEIQNILTSDQNENIIISISAASNVTSKMTNLKLINQIVKKARAHKKIILCVDCAAYCPHKSFSFKEYTEFDFVFLSPHKNLGGSQTCGVLIGRKNIIELSKPTFPGGGTVKFVKGYKKSDIMYEDNIFSREISGTPSFLGFYRAALSFQLLKKQITYEFIQENQKENISLFIQKVEAISLKLKKQKKDTMIILYGNKDFESRGNIITFNIVRKGQVMSHNMVSLLLSDLFGIQIRSGCFCAGPFGIKLLELSEQTIEQLQNQVSIGILKNKPGYCRIDLAFHFLPFEVNYLAKAIEIICNFGNQLSMFYTICNDGQIRRLALLKKQAPIFSLSDFSALQKEKISFLQAKIGREQKFKEQLEKAQSLLKNPIQFLKNLRK